MRQTKIVIKCDGLLVHTKDLGMGLSILSRLKEHGIMNHVEVPVSLLDKANELLKELCEKIEKYLLKQDAVEEPDDSFESALVSVTCMGKPKDADELQKDDAIDEAPIDEEAENIMDKIIDRSNERQHQWTKEEVNILKNNLDVTDKELDRLIPTRTLEAIKFKRRVLLGRIRSKKVLGKERIRWSNKELKALKANMHLKPRQLQKLPWLKRRTIDQINQKKHTVKKEMIVEKIKMAKNMIAGKDKESYEN